MHLIDTRTLKLTYFDGKPPPYAILSHTWGSKEVIFADFTDLSRIEATAAFNKESSAELSEAINSMFKWYRDAAICYSYIEDLPEGIELPITNPQLVKGCRWFSRGWTLQELLAPQDIIFFGPRWVNLGRKAELFEILEQVTGIPRAVLTGETRLDQVSVADRMNWAAKRQTTREEDIAYCLMGVFGVNMPMMYGEGSKAFLRLQEEIVKQMQDDSLFAWRASDQAASDAPYRGLFASSPREFANDVSITPFRTSMAGPTTILGDGRISLNCTLYPDSVLGLKCFRGTDVSSVVGIEVANTGANHFLRTNPSSLVRKSHIYPATFRPVVFERFAVKSEPGLSEDVYLWDGIRLADLPPEVRLIACHPKEYNTWNKKPNMVPTIYIVGKKFAFELEIDRKATGADVFHDIGWDGPEQLATNGEIRVLLIVWVEQQPATKSYAYHFHIEAVGPEDAEATFHRAQKPLEALNSYELALGWSMLHVKGSLTNENEHRMFSFGLSLLVREDVKAEAKSRVKENERRPKENERRPKENERWMVQECTLHYAVQGVLFAILLSVSVTPLVILVFGYYDSSCPAIGLIVVIVHTSLLLHYHIVDVAQEVVERRWRHTPDYIR